jgi:hypothetical protein
MGWSGWQIWQPIQWVWLRSQNCRRGWFGALLWWGGNRGISVHLEDERIRVMKTDCLVVVGKTLFWFSVDETCDRGWNSVVLLCQWNFIRMMKCLGYDSSLWKTGQMRFWCWLLRVVCLSRFSWELNERTSMQKVLSHLILAGLAYWTVEGLYVCMGVHMMLWSGFVWWCWSWGKEWKPWMLEEVSKLYENRLAGWRIGM